MTTRRNIQSCLATLALLLLPPVVHAQLAAENPTGPTGVYNGNITTAGNYDPMTGNQMRVVDDLVVPGGVGAYPLKWTRYYNTNVIDGQWTFSYKDYSHGPDATASGAYYYGDFKLPDGRTLGADGLEDGGSGPWGGPYVLLLADGGRVNFASQGMGMYDSFGNSVGYRVVYRPTQLIDPYGQVTTMTYITRGDWGKFSGHAPMYVLDRVTEPGGRYLQLTWEDYNYTDSAGAHTLNVIAKVEAFDGRGNSLSAVNYSWIQSPEQHGQFPLLDHVNYPDGTSAHYTYAEQVMHNGGGNQVHYPSLLTADDVRNETPMRQIAYGVYDTSGNLVSARACESNLNTHELLTAITFGGTDQHINPDGSKEITYVWVGETRADGATRTFSYSNHCTWTHPIGETLQCDDRERGRLIAYTDFLGHTTKIGYDFNESSPTFAYITSVTDPNGRVTKYTRGAVWGITRIDYPDGSFLEQTFTDNNGNPYYLASRTAQRGPNDPAQTTTYTRDGNHRITRKALPDGSLEEFAYNSFGQVLDHHLTSGGWEHFAYDARGLKTSYTDATGGVTTYSYYTSGPWIDRLQTVTHPANASGFQATETYEYDHTFDSNGNETSTPAGSRGIVTKITHTDGNYESFGFNKFGDKLWEEDELRHRTSYVYDEYGRVLTVTTPPRYAGDMQNHTVANSYIVPGGTSTETTSKLPFATVLPSGKQTTFEYDANWRKRFVHVAPGTADASTTEYRYDEGTNNVGHLTTTVDPRSNATTYGYDTRDRQTSTTDALNHMTSWNFDLRGNKMSEIHANNELITYDQYDPMNRLLQKSTHRDAGVLDVVHMTYDLAGNLHTNTDEDGNVYNYDYDAMNRPTQITYPNAKTEVHTYDAAGNIQTYSNRAGASQAFSYDNRNRQTNFTWTDGTSSQTSVYDAASRKAQIDNADATINFVYYDDNKLKSQEEWSKALSDNVHRTVTYTYDADGNRSTIQYPSGTKFDYDYTQRNQVADIKLDGQSSAIVSYSFDTSGNITNRSLDNSTSTAYTVDQVNRDTLLVSSLASSVTKRLDYAYNSVNDITAVQRDSGTGDGYKYDFTQQIKEFQQDGTVNLSAGTVAGGVDNTMSFDGCGNRTQLNNVNQSFNNMNQPTGAGFDHDNNGNLKSWNGWSYTYDAQNRLRIASNAAQGTTANFYYDGLNRQIARQISGGAPAPTPTPSATVIPTITPLPSISPTPTVSPSVPPLSTPTPTVPPINTPTPTIPPLGTPTPTPAPKCSPVNFTQTFNNPSGHWFVSMSCPNPSDATIFYTTDGSTPTHTGATATGTTQTYAGSIDIGNCGDHPFKAIAYKSGWLDSDVSSQDYDHGTCGSGSMMMSAQSSTVTIFSVWDGDWAILEEYDASGAVVEKYLQGYHGLVKTLVANVYYYQDELGSTSHIASASGALLEYYKYTLYGKPQYFSSTSQQLNASTYNVVDLGNGGARWIPQLGLYDDRNRFMPPDLGRFLQPDPIGFKGDSSNLYRYCGNDWSSRTDPTGLLASGDTDRQPESTNVDGPGHDFQRELSASERRMEVNVDAHHVENVEKARAESRGAGFSAELQRRIAGNPKFAQNGQGPGVQEIHRNGVLSVDTDGGNTTNTYGDRHHSDRTSGVLNDNGQIIPSGHGGTPLNANENPYVVANSGLKNTNGGSLRAGDWAAVTAAGHTVMMQIGDFSHKRTIEVSIAGARALGADIISGRGGPVPTYDGRVASPIRASVIYYPGSGL